MAKADLSYDSDAFSTAIAEYKAAKASFEDIKGNMTKCTNALRSGWKSDAGDAFFSSFDDDLSPALDKYINFMNYLIDILQKASAEYDPIVTEAEQLHYN